MLEDLKNWDVEAKGCSFFFIFLPASNNILNVPGIRSFNFLSGKCSCNELSMIL